MKFYAIKNVRNKKLVRGFDCTIYPNRAIFVEEHWSTPKLYARKEQAEFELKIRKKQNKTYKVVEVELKEIEL